MLNKKSNQQVHEYLSKSKNCRFDIKIHSNIYALESKYNLWSTTFFKSYRICTRTTQIGRLSKKACYIIFYCWTNLWIFNENKYKSNEMRGECVLSFLPSIQEPFLIEIQIIKRWNFYYSVFFLWNNLPFIGFSCQSRFELGSNKLGFWLICNKYNPKAVIQQENFATSEMAWEMIGLNN